MDTFTLLPVIASVYPNLERNHECASDLLSLAVGSIEEEARQAAEDQRAKDEAFDRHLSNFKSNHFTRSQLRQAKNTNGLCLL